MRFRFNNLYVTCLVCASNAIIKGGYTTATPKEMVDYADSIHDELMKRSREVV